MKKEMEKKGRLSATINKEVLQKFNEFCKTNSINKSDKIEKFILKFLEEQK